jgi:DNA-binding response OmpR family regulator
MSKIVLIEDSKSLGAALSAALKTKGHEVIWICDGREAFAAVKKSAPDAVLLDLMLPHISGYEICEMIKTDDICHRLPVIIMSTLTKSEQRDRAAECGADHFIGKPYDLQETLKEISKFLPKDDNAS